MNVEHTILSALLVTSPISTLAQNVGPGEQRFTAAIYKASHNSYDRDESLRAQIDDYNVWCLELDIWPPDHGAHDEIYVSHTCLLPTASTLSALLQGMSQSTTAPNRVTAVYLCMGNLDTFECTWPPINIYRPMIKQVFADALGLQTIYPASEFKNVDTFHWPSYQELVRRGYKWIVLLDDLGDPGDPGAVGFDDDFFFGVTTHDPPPSGIAPNTVLVNIDGDCDANPTDHVPAAPGGRWLYRLFPGTCSSDSCLQMNGKYWENALAKRFNFIASNCVNWDHTFQPPTHSPDPLFVNPLANVNCPNGYSTCDWGTSSFPYHDLNSAIDRADAMVTVLIQGGQYQISSAGNARHINKPIILKTLNGPARIN